MLSSAYTATAVACPNIAFIKYWGNQNDDLRIPQNGSLSMNLDGLFTQTRVTFDPGFSKDSLILNQRRIYGEGLTRVALLLNIVRNLGSISMPARVESSNNFPTGVGIASSASAFAALCLAATSAIGLTLSQVELSRLARRGSGSACRSIPGGFVEWQAGSRDEDSYAFSIAGPEHWDLVDCIAVVSEAHKPVGSSAGHRLAGSSPLQPARVADAPRRLELCRNALLSCDFEAFSQIVEQDNFLMHAVMMTSHPSLLYWAPASIAVMLAVQSWREHGIPACFTLDAGPNVHVITRSSSVEEVNHRLMQIPGVNRIISARPGGPARIVPPGNLIV